MITGAFTHLTVDDGDWEDCSQRKLSCKNAITKIFASGRNPPKSLEVNKDPAWKLGDLRREGKQRRRSQRMVAVFLQESLLLPDVSRKQSNAVGIDCLRRLGLERRRGAERAIGADWVV